LRQAKGRVINVASVAGRLGTPGTSSYNASKFAVEGLSDAWRRELAIWGIKFIIIGMSSMRLQVIGAAWRSLDDDVVVLRCIEPGIMKTPLWDQPFKDAETDAIWATLTPEQQVVYGREYFAECYNAGKDLVNMIGGNPRDVVVCIGAFAQTTMTFFCDTSY
jgi:NAD(P)-dependent dehydrogenase (short-subunit alcohol dehydrogenase family)